MTSAPPAPPPTESDSGRPVQPAPPGRLRRAAAGGRWRVWLLRGLVWLAVLGICLFVLRALLSPSASDVVDSALNERIDDSADLPVAAAENLAARFTHDYLTLGGETDLTPHLADGVDVDPIEGATHQRVLTTSPVDSRPADGGQLVVTVAAHVSTAVGEGTERRWQHLAVPVATDETGRVGVAGSPSLVPAPSRPAVEDDGRIPVDTQLSSELRGPVEEFMAAYGAGEQNTVEAFTTGDTPVRGLDEPAEVEQVVDVSVYDPSEDDAPGSAEHLVGHATVRWRQAGVTATQRYQLTFTRRDGQWLIDDLAADTALEPSQDTEES